MTDLSASTSPCTTLVQFIQLDTAEQTYKEQVICCLAAEYFAQQKTILIRADEDAIQRLDLALWKWPSHAFVPHAIAPCDTDLYPIVLAAQDCNVEHVDLVIAATHLCNVNWLSQFAHVIEFAEIHSEHLRMHSRERFKQWRGRGCSPSFQKEFILPETL